VRVLLVNSNQIDDRTAVLPIGLAYVAGAAEAAGHEIRVIDLCFPSETTDSLDREIQRFVPEVVGISVRNLDNANMLYPVSYVQEATRVVERVKALSKAPVVLGGPGVSIAPSQIIRRLRGDYVVVSDGERPFVELLDCLEHEILADSVPGVGTLVGKRFQLTPIERRDFPSVRPNIGKYVDTMLYEKIGATYGVQTKRGCRNRCTYCTYGQVLEGSPLRMRSPQEVVDEIEEISMRYHPKYFEFVDSVFNDPLDYCVEILEEIVSRSRRLTFTAMGVSPKGLDVKLLRLMKRAGFRRLSLTPEAASPKMIRNYRKGFDLEDVIHAAEAINAVEFDTKWFFLLGGPGETNDSLQETLDFNPKHLRKNGGRGRNLVIYSVGVRIYPGTALWNIAIEQGFIRKDSDPLDQLWYLSEELNLAGAIHQIIRTALECPDTSTGLDDALSGVPAISALVGDPFGIGNSHQSVLQRLATLLSLEPNYIARTLREQLMRQGYRGPLVGDMGAGVRGDGEQYVRPATGR
jgi:radical SAM superfamily enzyme YgiQ (UPF0313 family)